MRVALLLTSKTTKKLSIFVLKLLKKLVILVKSKLAWMLQLLNFARKETSMIWTSKILNQNLKIGLILINCVKCIMVLSKIHPWLALKMLLTRMIGGWTKLTGSTDIQIVGD